MSITNGFGPKFFKVFTIQEFENMEIYRVREACFMIIDVKDSFSFEDKLKSDKENPKVQEWETLMWKYQDGSVC